MFAARIDQIQPFKVMEVLDRAAEFEAAGATVVHFEVGEPDFPTAAPIVAAGIEALSAGHTKYTSATGIAPLKEAIVGHYQRLGLDVPASRIVITSGASAGLTLLAGLLLDPGDELLITDPGYPCNEVFARLAGGIPRAIPLGPNQGFQPAVEDVAQAWGPATKGVLLASPANPTGTMLDGEAIGAIAAYARGRDGFFILDEIYQGLSGRDLAAGKDYASGLSFADDLFILNSFSKYFGMTGWRLGWLVVPEPAVEGVTKLAQNLFIAPNAPAQYAALAAFSPAALEIHEERAAVFAARCRRLSDGLQQLGFHVPVTPDGAFYLYVDVSHTGMSGADFCWRLLEEFQVAVTPGDDFGRHQHERYVRFAYTTSEAAIDLGLERIDEALSAWGLG